MNKQKLLILGGTGLLGTYLRSSRQLNNYDLIVHGNNSVNCDIAFDLRDKDVVNYAICRIRPNYIINLVAMTNPDNCEQRPNTAYEVNARSVRNIFSCTYSAFRLVHLSTDHVYNQANSAEDDIRLVNYYSFSKYLGEKYVDPTRSVVLRTNFFGSINHPTRMTLSEWACKSLFEKKKITLFNDIYFSPLNVSSLALYIAMVLKTFRPGVYNLGSRDGFTKKTFILEIAKLFGLSSNNCIIGPSTNHSFTACRPNDMRMNSSKFEETYEVQLPRLGEEIRKLGES